MKRTIIILLTLTAASCGGRRGAKGAGDGADSLAATGITYPFTIDVSKEYPMDPTSLQEVFGEMEYVALETTPECLIGRPENPIVTDNDIFILSSRKSLLRFNRDGKFRNQIGREGRGPGEYISATVMCVNDRTKEVFIYDVLGDAIQVYDYDGRHKRAFRVDGTTIIEDMTAITDSTLLISNSSMDDMKSFVIYPFQLISSRDGKVVKTLMPPHKESRAFIPTDLENPYEKGKGMVSRPILEIDPVACKPGGIKVAVSHYEFGYLEEDNQIYVTDEGVEITKFVSDTVYVVSGAGGLTPRWIKAPSPMNISSVPKRRYSKFEFETDRYAFFSAAGNGDQSGYRIDKSTGAIAGTWLYDANMELRNPQDAPFNKIIFHSGVNTGRFAIIYEALAMCELRKEEKLSGSLAEIALTIKEDDNPVLLIQKN